MAFAKSKQVLSWNAMGYDFIVTVTMYYTLTFDIRKKDVTKHDPGYKSVNILQDSLNYTYLKDYKNIVYDCNL